VIRPYVARLLCAGLLLAAGGQRSAAQDDPGLERGRRLTRWLLAGTADSILPRMAPEFLASLGGVSGLRSFMDRVAALGDEVERPEEVVYHEAGTTSYYRIGAFESLPSATIHWVWDSAGTVQGLIVRPTPAPVASKHERRKTRTPLRLPFEGAAYVAWGGRRPHENYHVENVQQRYAYDFFLLEDGRIRSGSGDSNEDYACWGRPILAPADGVVRTVVDSLDDNRPGRMNPAAPPGNYVIIDHGRGEHSVLAHLRRGSVAVRSGEKVEAGRPVGDCGNSGNSSAPHLHYHLQTESHPARGVGLPAQFRDYRVGDREIAVGEPVRGQVVRPSGSSGLQGATR
jgi:murein DD-endopeptidase MepM/ murein hydrolase activator NlpD